MFTLTYVSTFALQEASDLLADAMLREIAVVARARNNACGLTGYLVFENGFFLQTIEGPHAEVERVYESIARDSRHRELTILHHGAITERTFPSWGMTISVRRGGRREVATVVAYLKARAHQAPATLPHEYFRDLLAPSRLITTAANRGTEGALGAPLRIALCSASTTWLASTFEHIAARFGDTLQKSRIANPDGATEPVLFEYIDARGASHSAIRVIGVSEGLLASQAAFPLIANLDLIVLLAGATENERYLDFVERLLAQAMPLQAPSSALLVCPDLDAKFIPEVKALADQQGASLALAVGSHVNGHAVWTHIDAWLRGK